MLYAGQERLDTQRRTLGEPPLVDGAVLSLQVPGEAEPPGADIPAQLHVVAGPDAGGVHLLHGGQISIGRSADADVPLDDPDVSRLHCAVTVAEDGRVTVADLGSTNGTTLGGSPVGSRPVRLPAGALLRLGESTLRLTAGDGAEPLPTAPDGEGHLRVRSQEPSGPGSEGAQGPYDADAAGTHGTEVDPGQLPAGPYPPGHVPERSVASTPAHGTYTGPAAQGPPRVPTQYDPTGMHTDPLGADAVHSRASDTLDAAFDPAETHTRQGGPARGSRKRGIGAWARRLAGARDEPATEAVPVPEAPHMTAPVVDSWPDPAAVLLTALGPGPRLWERGPAHPESLVLRLGTTDRAELPSVPVTVGLREAGSLGLAGPRARLAALARSAVAQLAALHSPADLEIVLISTDRARSIEERRAEWAWLGWLPHLRPAHGQDCRLLLAYDRDQATARTAELTRRLDAGPLGPGWPSADGRAVSEAADRHDGPRTVVIVDGDPGSAVLRETTARLAGAGRAARDPSDLSGRDSGRLAHVPGRGDVRDGVRGLARLP